MVDDTSSRENVVNLSIRANPLFLPSSHSHPVCRFTRMKCAIKLNDQAEKEDAAEADGRGGDGVAQLDLTLSDHLKPRDSLMTRIHTRYAKE